VLARLSISNLAIVEDVQVNFQQGFHVLTGETGAGKSILMGAISLLGGKKASSSDVRSGQEHAFVEAELKFSTQSEAWTFLDQHGIALSNQDESVTIKRMVSASGKNRVYINQQSTTVSTLQLFAKYWLDMTSQHAQHRFKDPLFQIELLDMFAQNQVQVQAYRDVFIELKREKNQLRQLLLEKKKIEEEQEFFAFQLDGLEKAALVPGELDELEQSYARVKHAKDIADGVGLLIEILSKNGGLLENLSACKKQMARVSKWDDSLKSFLPQLGEIQSVFVELEQEVRTIRSASALSQGQVDKINARISDLQSLAKKYGSIEHAIEKRDELRRKLVLVSKDDVSEVDIRQRVTTLEKRLGTCAKALTQTRQKASKVLGTKITGELQFLGMENALLQIDALPWSKDGSTIEVKGAFFHATGAEQFVFMFAPNLGERMSQVASIASGGEMSRIMLAIKSVSIQSEESIDCTYLFDEVDTGTGGETALRIGRRMSELAQKNTQVLSVTHLAQVAAFADHHAFVHKETSGGRTRTRVALLDDQARRTELARMVSGGALTPKTYEFVSELLEKKAERPFAS